MNAEPVGSLMWLATMMQPNITFATAFLACFMSLPTDCAIGVLLKGSFGIYSKPWTSVFTLAEEVSTLE